MTESEARLPPCETCGTGMLITHDGRGWKCPKCRVTVYCYDFPGILAAEAAEPAKVFVAATSVFVAPSGPLCPMCMTPTMRSSVYYRCPVCAYTLGL